MASRDNRIYRSRRPWQTIVMVLLAILAVVLILAVAVFFYFKRYIVYTSDGLRLEVPWLEEAYEEPQEAE